MEREEQMLRRFEAAQVIGADAGILLGKMFGKSMDGLHKLDMELKPEDGNTPRTVIDTKVGGLIKREITRRFPDDTIISEDVKGVTGTNGWCWWVDPFDGTANAEGQFPWSVTGIGVSFESEMVIGVVANPFEDTVTYAATGRGASCEPTDCVIGCLPTNFEKRKIHVSNGRRFARRVIVVDGLWNKQTARFKSRFRCLLGEQELVQNHREVGSNLLAWSLVAQGRADAAFMDAVGGFWDAAAGIVLVQEAGGRMTNPLTGKTPKDGDELVLATNDEKPAAHEHGFYSFHDTLAGIAVNCYAGYTGFRPPKK